MRYGQRSGGTSDAQEGKDRYTRCCPSRGHNRQVVFAADEDFQFYLENLTELKGELDVRLYAYCLMTNHVHLLLMPAQAASLASLLKALAGRQTRYVNRVEGRSGTLWEGRYKSSPVDTERYLLECSRYIELNPLRAGIVGRSEQYCWSSFGGKAGLREDRRLDLDPCYLAMGEAEHNGKVATRRLCLKASDRQS